MCLIVLLTYELRLETRTSTSSPSLNDYLSICAKSSSQFICENRYLVILGARAPPVLSQVAVSRDSSLNLVSILDSLSVILT
eukprot:scaffold5136_cov66-Phaeocystis_antarctica.AAC.1